MKWAFKCFLRFCSSCSSFWATGYFLDKISNFVGNLTPFDLWCRSKTHFFRENFAIDWLFTYDRHVISWAPLDSRLTLHPNGQLLTRSTVLPSTAWLLTWHFLDTLYYTEFENHWISAAPKFLHPLRRKRTEMTCGLFHKAFYTKFVVCSL